MHPGPVRYGARGDAQSSDDDGFGFFFRTA
jgi:hypothetical protein